MMQVTLKVRRFDPDTDRPEARFQEYDLEMEDTATVLDGLIKVREEIDGTLTLRCSCRSAICGSCAMRINGQAGLACNTKMSDAIPRGGGPVTVEPAGNMRVIKDLVTDFQPFWDKVRAVEPWLQPEGPEPEAEYIAPNEAMLHEAGVMACIMCRRVRVGLHRPRSRLELPGTGGAREGVPSGGGPQGRRPSRRALPR